MVIGLIAFSPLKLVLIIYKIVIRIEKYFAWRHAIMQ